MKMRKHLEDRPKLWWLLPGDILVLALVTFFGFARHGTLGSAGLRMLSTFVPLTLAWLLIAPHLGAFDETYCRDPRQIWRPFWAMVLGGPLAAFFRGVLLGQPVQIVFVIVLGGVSALSLAAWRFVYWFWRYRPAAIAAELTDPAVQ
jgi:hypothetical protein